MIRIGLVGSASPHAATYARLLNVDRIAGDRARISAIWSSIDPDHTAEITRDGAIPEITDSLHHLVDRVDAGIIVNRHGDLHAEHALPLLLERKPVFVDVPLGIDLADCRRMLDAARRAGTVVASFPALGVAPGTEALRADRLGRIRLLQLAGPCDFASPHGGPFFEITHLIELALSLLGEDVAGVQVTRAGDTVVADVIWANDAIGSLGFVRDAGPTIHASLFGTQGAASREIRVDGTAHAALLRTVVEMFETGRSPHTPRRLLLPIVIANAVVRSLDQNGAWVDVAGWLDRELETLG